MEKGDSHKVLVIKTGYTEFLDNGDGSMKVSLGDILRVTPLLYVYKNDNVTWLSDKYAFPLLEGNPYISRLMHLDFKNSMQLLNEDFDTVINLEKNPEICLLADKVNAWRKYGFRIDKRSGEIHAYDRAFEVFEVSSESEAKKRNKKTTQELLFEMVGQKWNGEDYVLGYQPKTREIYDIGFNTIVGGKWLLKAWPEKNWNKLESKLKQEGFSVSRQDKQGDEVLSNLFIYMNWLNSCRLIVTNDTLGTHLSLALKKKVLGLFGPTSDKEYYFYNRGKAIFPEEIIKCRPCYSKAKCQRGRNCMEDISLERVYQEIKELMK